MALNQTVARSMLAPAARKKDLRLMIAGGQQLFRECLCEALGEAESPEVWIAEDRAAVLRRLESWHPHVLLLGLDVAAAGGAAALVREIGARAPAVRVLVLGGRERAAEMAACLEAGAHGSISREQSLGELRDAIYRVARGETVCVSAVAYALLTRLSALGLARRRRERLDFLNLTPRELEVLRLIDKKLSNQEIARRLYLSVHTVKNHVHSVLAKLSVESRAEAVRHAYRRGWFKASAWR